MKSRLTRTQVKREFTYIRSLLVDAKKTLATDFDNSTKKRQALANELVAAANIYSQWVDEQESPATVGMTRFDEWLGENGK